MHKLDVYGETEDKNHIREPVDLDGKILVGNDVHKGYVGVNQGAHEADGGKEEVGRLPAPPEDGEKGQTGKDKETEDRWNN